jgi:hypothetical protein
VTVVEDLTGQGPAEVPSAAVDDRWRWRWRPFLIASGLYLLGSLLVWWNIWSTSPISVTTCGCGDSALFLWFFEWPAYALAHGLSPLFSTAMSYPTGVNLLANTSELGFGVPLAPVTWIFGPTASMNVALLLAPALSASAMFALTSRWVRWTPAAFAAGLLFGFSPMALVALSDAHLMIGMAAPVPLIVLCLDELIRRQKARPVLVGIGLGLCVAFEFFIGTEVLVITALCVGFGVLIVLAGSITRLDAIAARARHALVGIGTGAATSLILLAYPAWYALAGPGAISGPVWPTLSLGIQGATIKALFVQTPASQSFTEFTHRVGGSQGVTLSGQYFGWGLGIVVLLGLVVWFRDRRLWLLGIMSVVTAWISLGISVTHWAPWNLLGRRPLFENIIPSRFLIITYLAIGAMLAIVMDRVHDRVVERVARRHHATHAHHADHEAPRRISRTAVAAGAAAGLLVGAVGLFEPTNYMAKMLPIAAEPVVLPDWFDQVAPTLPAHQVLLIFPVPFALIESSMAWQAENRMKYSMVGGGGPNGVIERAGEQAPGQKVIGSLSFTFKAATITPKSIKDVRRALESWGVTKIVIPDQPDLPLYDQIASVTTAAGAMTLATGIAPRHEARAWVWDLAAAAPQPHLVSTDDFAGCTLSVAPHGTAAVGSATSCLLSAPEVR